MKLKIMIIPFIFSNIANSSYQSSNAVHLDFLKRTGDLRGEHAGLFASRPFIYRAHSQNTRPSVMTDSKIKPIVTEIAKCPKQEA